MVSITLSDLEKKIIFDRFKKYNELRDFYVKAEELKIKGEKEITIPIEVFLLSRDIVKSVHSFYSKMNETCSDSQKL